jgi:hypothetical protein
MSKIFISLTSKRASRNRNNSFSSHSRHYKPGYAFKLWVMSSSLRTKTYKAQLGLQGKRIMMQFRNQTHIFVFTCHLHVIENQMNIKQYSTVRSGALVSATDFVRFKR